MRQLIRVRLPERRLEAIEAHTHPGSGTQSYVYTVSSAMCRR